MINKGYSKRDIQKIKRSPSPRVLLNVCTHGSERVGLKVADRFSDFEPLRGSFFINFANKRALNAKKRFISSDLNRVFPGKENGNYEEQLAYKMVPFVKSFDLVIDVHSTESGVYSAAIVTKLNDELTRILKATNLSKIILMKATKSNALISQAKLGIALECGNDKSQRTLEETVDSINRILACFEMTALSNRSRNNKTKKLFEAYDVYEKPDGYIVSSKIKNFKSVAKGETVGIHRETDKRIVAKDNFIPLLFGNNTYKTIFGFKAKEKEI